MKKQMIFICILFLFNLFADSATVTAVRITSPTVAEAGLLQSIGVFRRVLEQRAPALQFTEGNFVAPVSGVLAVRILPYLAPEKSPGPEGYRLRITRDDSGGLVAEVAGADRRGTLFGLGALYRCAALRENGIALPENFEESSAPRYEFRSVNNPIPVNMDGGMIKTTGARKWSYPEAILYQEELFLLGQNGIAHGWGAAVPVDFAKYDGKRGIGTTVQDFTHEYGMLYLLSCSVNGIGRNNMKPDWKALIFRYRSDVHACVSNPEARAALIAAREIAAKHTPSLDYAMLLPGDVAGCDCPKCHPWELTYYNLAVDMARAIHKYHPKAKVLISNQEFRIEQNKRFFERYYQEKSPELAGYAYGPGSSENSFYGYVKPNLAFERYPGVYPESTFLKSRLNYLAPGNTVLAFMDIGHWKRSQAGLTAVDPVYSEVFERRSFNACPERMGRIWREVLPYVELGVGYSESIFDDFSKYFTLRLLWAPQLSNREITREYAALYGGENVADLLTSAIYLQEANVERPMAGNREAILKCHAMVEEAWAKMSPPYRRNNWRIGLLRQRAAFDAFLAERLEAQQKCFDRVMTELEKTDGVPADATRQKWIAELENSGKLPAFGPYLAIMRETDAMLDEAAGLKSIALHRLFDRPDNVGCNWLIAQLKAMSGNDAAKIRHDTIFYDRVGPGEFYDNCGTPGKMPHFDPKSGEIYYGSGRFAQDSRPSQRSYCFTSDAMEGVRFVYEGLDPAAEYKVEFTYPNPDGVTFALNSPNEFDVFANGTLLGRCVPGGMHFVNPTSNLPGREKRLLSPPEIPVENFTRFAFDIPKEATAGGSLVLQFRKAPERGLSTCVSEIWIRKR